MNRMLGTLVIAYYNDKMEICVDYYGYYSDNWVCTKLWNNSMDTLRKEILKAGMCDILYDDGEA